ncbi:hypothetical protein A2U01_0092074, partial [Trifolium medium]|nr:hypothetical protein [Trifolium medium]
EDWRPSCCLGQPVVDPCLSLPKGYSCSRSGVFERL